MGACCMCGLKNMVETKPTGARSWHKQLIDQIEPVQILGFSKGQSGVLQGQVQLNHKDPALRHYRLLPMPCWGKSYSSAEVQSAYSTASANRVDSQMVPSIAMLYQYSNLSTQLKSFKSGYLTLFNILFNITHLFSHSQTVWSIAMNH